MLSTLALIAAPSSARNRTRSAATICMNNMRQLTVAWLNYADDQRQGKLAENYGGGEAQDGNAGKSGGIKAPWACGWLDWFTRADNTNELFLRSNSYARLGPYISTVKNIHKCPSDFYLSDLQRAAGWKERVRTISMNATIGNGNAQAGPWNPIYGSARTLSDLNLPSPAESNVFIEEHPDSMNDPTFFPPSGSWMDVPAGLHQNASNVSFADGHVEAHSWRGSVLNFPVKFRAGSTPQTSTEDADLNWVMYHSHRTR